MSDITEPIVHLRILVLALGESQHAGWWNCQFLTPTGLSFLERIYPRSKFAAAVRSAGRAALMLHDERIGRGDAAHLFRLPLRLEQAVDDQLSRRAAEFEALFVPMLPRRAALLESLAVLAGAEDVGPGVGPQRIHASAGRLPAALAAAYGNALRSGGRVFPYFEPELRLS